MKIMIVCIGNTDNKLTQQEWFAFSNEINLILNQYPHTLHFFGGPPTHSPYQNVLWMFEIEEKYIKEIKDKVKKIREMFWQNSVLTMVDDGEFV